MRRKLIAQRDSLTLTLPKDWVKKHNLSSKDELDIIEDEGILILNSQKKEVEKDFTIDVTNYSDSFIRNLLNQIYISSATKIIITSSKQSKITLCEKLNSLFLVGFHVTEKTNQKIVLEQFTHIKKEDFDKFLLKIFNHVDASFDLLLEDKNSKESIDEIKRDTKNLTQYKNICRKILLNESTAKSEDKIVFEIISFLTEINHLIFHLLEDSIAVNKKLVFEIKEMFGLIKQGYFKNNLEKINESQMQYEKLLMKNISNSLLFSLIRANYNLSNSVISKILLDT